MLERLKNIDHFTRNVILVFVGSFLANFSALLYQLLIAHKLTPADFAAFNSLLAIFSIISAPLATIQLPVARFCAEFNARNQPDSVRLFLSDLFKKVLVLSVATLFVFWLISINLLRTLKIPSLASGYILAFMLASTWLIPVLAGGVQGLEFFSWLTASVLASGILKLALAFVFIVLGYKIAGALGAFLLSNLAAIGIYYYPLRNLISFGAAKERIDYKEMFAFLFPVAIAQFCFLTLVSTDLILVKYYFNPEDSGIYSLAQMVGKIFLFLPQAIGIVMFPKTSGLNAQNKDTLHILKESLLYVSGLCISAVLLYNLFPAFILKVLTGKVYSESIFLGRMFSVSMSFFTLLYILFTYFLSIKDLRFLKYLTLFTVLQCLGIILFHNNLFQVQLVLCLNAIVLFLIHLCLVVSLKRRVT